MRLIHSNGFPNQSYNQSESLLSARAGELMSHAGTLMAVLPTEIKYFIEEDR